MALRTLDKREAIGMSKLLTRIRGILLKALLVLVMLSVAAFLGLRTYSERTSRPLGSPPIGFENRLKYERGHISDRGGFDNIPVDLWFGKNDGRYDTTRLRIASDYLSKIPFWHGESATLYVVWPSLRSIDEENEIRKKKGQAPVREAETFVLAVKEANDSYAGTDKNGTASSGRCEPLILDESRKVKHCNTPPYDKPGERWTFLWPLDESLITPYYHNPPRFECRVVNLPNRRYDRCFGHFSYNADLYVQLEAHEALAAEILANFSSLTKFLQSLEVKS